MVRLIINSGLCLLLITTFVFVATPAIAQQEITVTAVYEEANDIATVTVTLTYSEAPDPELTEDEILFTASTTNPFTVTFDGGDDGDPKTYFITYSNLDPYSWHLPEFTLPGYLQVQLDIDGFLNTPISGLEDGKLTVDTSYLFPGSYLVVVAEMGEAYPTLPTTTPTTEWETVSDESEMPNLYELFADGGTLNLRLTETGTTNRVGSKKEDGTYDDTLNRNQRQMVINEVMWAQDEARIGFPDDLRREQWIELYYRSGKPIPHRNIKLITSKAFPGPPAETDRLSNLPSFLNIWEIDDKGQHGNSRTTTEFKSMHRIKRDDDNYGDGSTADNWRISTRLYLTNYRGTPGQQNIASRLPTPRRKPGKDNPAKNKIIINEIGNFADDTLDWIELRNVTGSAQSLNNWVLTYTTGFGNEIEIIRFPNKSIPARGVLLLVNRTPGTTPLSAGFDISLGAEDQEFGAGLHQYLIVDDDKLEIPNDDAWLLILRSNKPWDVGEERDVYQTGFRVEDAAGPGALHDDFVVMELQSIEPSYEKKADGKTEGDIWVTKVFPLNGNTQDDGDFLQSDRLNDAGKVWARDGDKQGYLKDAWKQASFTGIGYDRKVEMADQYGGTPGYLDNVARGKLSQLDGGRLIVSELMLTNGNKGYPQWIELFNNSKTRGIDLAADSSDEGSDDDTGWQLIVENHNSGSWKENNRELNITINLRDLFDYIPPNQPVLIVSYKGRNSERDYFPDSLYTSIYNEKSREFSMENRKDLFLNAEGGFYIKIVDGDGNISDEVGNLDGELPNPQRGIGLDDPFSWNWSTALTEDGHRTSLIRLRDENGRPRDGLPDRRFEGDMTGAVLPMGMVIRPPKYAWVHAVDTAFERVPKIWYGNSSDIGTPGFVKGVPLPVSLSFFRATYENGEVVIRWTTESETDNAGFNILRSTHQDGNYKQINTTLIQGAGTTGQRQTYKWVDPTAKPSVLYYYQIEDVSFAGESQILTTSRLKGHISAKNKLTTTWSELKYPQ